MRQPEEQIESIDLKIEDFNSKTDPDTHVAADCDCADCDCVSCNTA